MPNVSVPEDADITFYLVNEPEPGAWCTRCLLPSAVDGLFLFDDADGRLPLGYTARLRVCMDCGGGWRVPDPT